MRTAAKKPRWQNDDTAFEDAADPNFPWIRVTFGEKPAIPYGVWVYYLQANGRTRLMKDFQVPWFEIYTKQPGKLRPIAYILTDRHFDRTDNPGQR